MTGYNGQSVIVTHPKSGQVFRTACRRGRIQFCDDSDKYRYLLFWRGVELNRVTDFYVACQIMMKCCGARFNNNEVWA